MSESDLFNDRLFPEWKNVNGAVYVQQLSSRRSLRAKFDEECSRRENISQECSSQFSRPGANWCDALSSSFSNVNAKQAWKNGTEKLSQTLNNVRTTFGSLSQKIKKSTKKRQPLINVDSPRSPVTPYTRSKAALGRTPTKLYSPFGIDTPIGKENISNRVVVRRTLSTSDACKKGSKKKQKTPQLGEKESNISSSSNYSPEMKLSSDLLQTQIGIYEFQSVANRIVQEGSKK